jgi:hypothetical protein
MSLEPGAWKLKAEEQRDWWDACRKLYTKGTTKASLGKGIGSFSCGQWVAILWQGKEGLTVRRKRVGQSSQRLENRRQMYDQSRQNE